MKESVNRWCELAGILTEQESKGQNRKKDLHIFDFDDTLGVTTSPTIVAAVEYSGGDPEDPASYIPIRDLKSRVSSKIKGLKSPEQSAVNSPGLSGNNVRSSDELDDSEAIILDTEQYRDWKEKYIPSGDHVRLVISPNISNDIRSAGRKMQSQGTTGEIHVADFSPSSTIGDQVKPINQILDILATANAEGDETAVVTARKGETDLDALGGGKIPATNAEDIEDFISQEIGSAPDIVIGAADYNPTDPASGKRDVIAQIYDQQVDNVHFYDDDPENARRVAQLCQGVEGMDGVELDIYNYDFAKGADASKPSFSCVVGEDEGENRFTESQLRRIIRKLILETEIRKKKKVGASAALTASGYYGYEDPYLDDYDGHDSYDDYDDLDYDDYDDYDDFDDFDDAGYDDGGDGE